MPTGFTPTRLRRSPLAFTLLELMVVITVLFILIALLLPVLSRARDSATSTRCLSNLRQIGTAAAQYSTDYHGYIVPGGCIDPATASTTPATWEDWATLLINDHYLPAPARTATTISLQTVTVCPADMPSSCAITDNATVGWYPINSHATHLKVFTRYGINATTSIPNSPRTLVPCRRIPLDNSSSYALYTISQIPDPAHLVFLFDGNFMNQMWVDPTRVVARHASGQRTNILFFDSHVESVPRSAIPSTLADFQNLTTLQTKYPHPKWYITQ